VAFAAGFGHLLGHSGYVASYRFAIVCDEVRMLAIRQQCKLGCLP
jgi:hypothetical protein